MRSAARGEFTVTTKARAPAAPARRRNSRRAASPKKTASPRLRAFARELGIGVERDERHVLRLEQPTDDLPDPAIATDDDMIGSSACSPRRHAVAMLDELDAAGQRTRADRQERREHHADADHRRRALGEFSRHKPVERAERDHDEGEFAGLRQQDRRLDRHGQRHAEQAARGKKDRTP